MDLFKQLDTHDIEVSLRFLPLVTQLEINGITTGDLLVHHHQAARNKSGLVQLLKRLGRSLKEVEEFIDWLTGTISHITVEEDIGIIHEEKKIPTGLEDLDHQLNGGILPGKITEIFGASGCGKSQFLFQLACQSQCFQEKNKVVYINTETFLETKRLQQIVDAYNAKKPFAILMDNIDYVYCQDLEIQDHILFTQLQTKLDKDRKIRSVIIDSISHHLRRDDVITNSSYLEDLINQQQEELSDINCFKEVKQEQERQLQRFFKSTNEYKLRISKKYYIQLLYRQLQRLARDYEVAIIVTNQVSDQPDVNFDFDLFVESNDPLDFEYQIGSLAGWDNKTILNYQSQFTKSNLTVGDDSYSSFFQLKNSINSNKRQKNNLQSDEDDPRYKTSNQQDDPDQYSLQVKLLDDLHKSNNVEVKRHIPSLGYQWNKLVSVKILLFKTYKPSLKSKADLESISDDNYDSDSKKRKFNDINIESIIDGWNIERYIKVVASSSPYTVFGQKVKFGLITGGLQQL